MAQDITGTSLLSNSQARDAVPCFRVRFDWADAGFGSIATWTDESTRVKNMSGESRAVSWEKSIAALGSSASGVCHITLDNEECTTPYSGFRFSPTNASGALYAEIGSGKLRMKRCQVELGYKASGTPQYVPVLTGYIVDTDEGYSGRTVTLEVRDRSSAAVLTRASSVLYEDISAAQYIATIAALVDLDPPSIGGGDLVTDQGIVLHPYAWLDDERVWEEMKDLAEANGGRVWFDHAGVLRFESLGHLVRPQANAWENPLTSQYAFTVNRFRDCEPRSDPESVINHVIIEATPLYESISQSVYKAGEVYAVPPAGSLVVQARHRWPCASIETPVETTDYLALTAGGTDISTNVSLAVTSKATGSEITITNANGSYVAYMYLLQLRGTPLLSAQSIRVEVEDAASIAIYGRQTETIKNPYIQSRAHAVAIAAFVLARYKSPPLTISLRGSPATMWLECGDRVTGTETLTGINTDFIISGIKWSYEGGGIEQSLDLVKASDLYPYTNYFQIGTTKWGGSGTSGSGRLMW